MAVDDVYKLTISATGQGSIYQNVLNLQMKAEADPTPANFNTFIGQWIDVFRTQQAQSIVYTEWEAIQQWGSNMAIDAPRCRRLNAKQFGGAILGISGSGSGDELPPQNALVFTWLTGFAGRRKRGRSYVFGLRESDQAAGLWAPVNMTMWIANVNGFLGIYRDDTGTSPTFTLGVWSERTASGCVPATAPQTGHRQVDQPHPELAFTPVQSAIVRETVYSQRRRTRGVGR